MEPARLTPRQRQVLELLAKRKSNQEIADELGISLDGAKWHVRELLQAYGVGSREEAAERYRIEHGLPRRLWRMSGTAVALGAVAGCAAVVAVAAFILLTLRDGTGDDSPGQSAVPSATSSSAAVSSATPSGTAVALTPAREGTTRFVGPPSRASGDAFIDAVTARLESGLTVGRSELAGQMLPCIEKSFLATDPPCPTNSPPGTPVLSFITFQCEIEWIPLNSDTQLATQPADDLRLHSIARGGASYTRPPAISEAPDFWMFFANSTATLPSGFAVAVKDGKVVSFGRSCGTFESMVQRLGEGSVGYLVAPP